MNESVPKNNINRKGCQEEAKFSKENSFFSGNYLIDDSEWTHEYNSEISIRDSAIASRNYSACLEAIKKISNDEFIYDVAIAYNNENLYIEAINDMINDRVISQLAIASDNETVCKAAINEMINDTYIEEVKIKLNSLVFEREKKEKEAKEKEAKEKAAKENAERERAIALAREHERKQTIEKSVWYSPVREQSSSELTRSVYLDPCQHCRCRSFAQAYMPQFHLEVNFNCEYLKMTATMKGDYYWCNKGGPPKDSSPGGWFPGRGF